MRPNKTIVFIFSLMFAGSYFILQAQPYKVVVLDRTDAQAVNRVVELFDKPEILLHMENTIDGLRTRFASESYFVLLVQNDQGVVLGALPYYVSSSKEHVWIKTIAVHPDYQRKGIATALLRHLKLLAGNRSVHASIIASNVKMHNLLKKAGYVQTDYFIALEKSIVKTDIIMAKQKVSVHYLDRENEQQVAQFCDLFDINEIGFCGPADIKRLIHGNKYVFLCAITGDNIVVGGLILKQEAAGAHGWLLDMLSVHKSYRGRGIATQLIMNCEQLAPQEGIEKLLIVVRQDNVAAYNLYKKLGFVEKDAVINLKK